VRDFLAHDCFMRFKSPSKSRGQVLQNIGIKYNLFIRLICEVMKWLNTNQSHSRYPTTGIAVSQNEIRLI